MIPSDLKYFYLESLKVLSGLLSGKLQMLSQTSQLQILSTNDKITSKHIKVAETARLFSWFSFATEMRSLIVLSLAFAAALAVPIAEVDPFVVGGENALPGQFPYIVSLLWNVLGVSTHVCGGSIISGNWILTAAHCITEIPQIGRITVLAGGHNRAAPDTSVEVISEIVSGSTVLHPDWTPGPQVGPDDLALLLLATPLVFNARIRPIRLPAEHSIPVGQATLSGWGSTGGTTLPNILQFTTKPIITLAVCRQAFNELNLDGNLVDDTNLCTGPLTGGVSACSGDSGGPLVQGAAPNEIQIGVVSWGVTP